MFSFWSKDKNNATTTEMIKTNIPTQENVNLSIPAAWRSENDYEIIKIIKKDPNFVAQVKKKNDDSNTIYYLKKFYVPTSTSDIESQIEAYMVAAYQIIAPQYVPSHSYVLTDKHNSQKVVGLLTTSRDDFLPLNEHPLLSEHLNVKNLNYFSITELESLLKKANDPKQKIWVQNKTDPIAEKYIQLKKSHTIKINKQNILLFDDYPNTQMQEKISTISLTVKDLENFVILKGLTIALVIALLFCDGDLHRTNLSINGVMIDLGWALAPLITLLRQQNLKGIVIDQILTDRFNTSYHLTAENIIHFPILADKNGAKLYYFPTIKNSSVNSKNAYTDNDIFNFSKLKDISIVTFFKFKTFLKFILINPEIYKLIAPLYLKPNTCHQNKNINDNIDKFLRNRVEENKKILVHLPQFFEFLVTQGRQALSLILDEVREHNTKMLMEMKKNPYYKNLFINEQSVIEAFEKLNHECFYHSIERIIKQNPQEKDAIFFSLLKYYLAPTYMHSYLEKHRFPSEYHFGNNIRQLFLAPRAMEDMTEFLINSKDFYNYLIFNPQTDRGDDHDTLCAKLIKEVVEYNKSHQPIIDARIITENMKTLKEKTQLTFKANLVKAKLYKSLHENGEITLNVNVHSC